jgi:hypothetical protein
LGTVKIYPAVAQEATLFLMDKPTFQEKGILTFTNRALCKTMSSGIME